MSRLRVLWSYWNVRRRRFASREALEVWQERRVRAHLRGILPKSPYLRERFGGLPLERWRGLEPIEKPQMVANFRALNTVGLGWDEAMDAALEAERTRDFSKTVRGITVGLSSGTSGARGVFIASPAEHDLWAGVALAKMLPGSILGAHRVAFFLRANSNVYETVGSRRIRFEFFDLIRPLDELVDRLQAYQPTLVSAPPSMLRLLAEAQRAGRLSIRPTKIISVAEVLDPVDAKVIGEVFGQTVHQAYQATEGFLGATCALGTLHLNEDLAVFDREYLDRAARKFVPVVTDFHRISQPFIRHRLNDILTERATPCPCGSVLLALERIEGRCDDLLYWPSLGDGPPRPVFPDFVTRAILAASPDVVEYFVVATEPGALDVSLELRGGATGGAERAVTHALAELAGRLGCRAPAVRFVPKPDRPDLTRKLRRVERRHSAPSAPAE